MAGGEAPLQVFIDPKEWARLKADLDKFDPALSKALKRRIREAGSDAVAAVKQAVLLPPPTDSNNPTTGARADIARATRLATSFTARGAGAKIITGGVRNGFSKAYNMGTFRHPVYGGGAESWVTQQGRPYFGSTITASMRTELVRKVRLALDEAVTAIGGKGR